MRRMSAIPTTVAAIVAGVAWLAASTAHAQPAAIDFSALDPVIEQELKATQTPGAAISIVSGDRVVFSKGYGLANVETREPVRPGMLFRLGSTTKMFTAAALVLLAEQGAIDLTKPIGDYAKGLHPSIARLTAHQLLSHTSGILDEAPMFGSHDETALEKEVRSWTESRFFTEPGRIYSYSNPGYWLSGFLIETLGGKRYADQMDASLFKPIGMAHTTLRPHVAMTYPLAQGHDEAPAGPAIIRPIANNAASWPAGSIFSSVEDLSRFVIAFMNGGRIGQEHVLLPAVIARLSQPNVTIPGSDASYSYGLEIAKFRGVDVIRHGGSRAGYGSQIRMAPRQRVAVIITANRTGIGLNRTADKAMELMLPLEAAPATTRAAALAMTTAEMAALAGTYSQAVRTLTLSVRDGKLFLQQGGRETAIEKVRDNELRAGEARFVVVTGAGGRPEYLHAGGRSWRKTP
jgi:CubicO group peptidase (beta-lactamase class C family)